LAIRNVALITSVLVAAVTVRAQPAQADDGCAWVGLVWECGLDVNDVWTSSDYDSPVTFKATLQRLDDVRLGFGSVGDPAPCIVGTTELDPAGEGFLYFIEAFSNIDGSVEQRGFRCVAAGESPVPPPLPSRAEIWQAAPVPQPVIHVSPYVDGLVGLDTWLWGDPHGSVSISLSLRGWAVAGTASPSEWVFETSDGGHYAADNPGSEDWPVGKHVFSHHGTYGLTHTVSWGGGFTVSGYGFSFNVDGLATSFTSTRDYDVIEIEAVGVPLDDD
jgi:hypothetical protein